MRRKYFGTDGIRGEVGKGAITPEFMLRLGWAAGKVFHKDIRGFDPDDWDQYNTNVGHLNYPPFSATVKKGDLRRLSDFGPVQGSKGCFDAQNTNWMCRKIRPGDDGQFWGFGLYRPHLPFIVPQQYFDLYPETVGVPPGLKGVDFDPDDRIMIAPALTWSPTANTT